MQKFFNTAGPCLADEHYMIPSAERRLRLHRFVRKRQFFNIHAPRQVGKTTLIQDFVFELSDEGDYLAIYFSLETARGLTDLSQGMTAILSALYNGIQISPHAKEKAFSTDLGEKPSTALLNALRDYCLRIDKPLVMMIDEADSLSEQVLISFLTQLRQGYVERGIKPFVHSLALVGMRNLRDYKARLREGRETLGSASPFNVVTEALTVPNFTEEQVQNLLGQHREETGQEFPAEAIARIFHYSQGQPWLVNAIAREIVDVLLDEDTSLRILPEHVEQAIQQIILRRDTHIDSLLERLKEPRVRRIVEPVILGQQVNLEFSSDDAAYVFDLGLLVKNRGNVKPANPIYQEVIIRALTYDSQYQLSTDLEGRYIRDGQIQMGELLESFQTFWRENSDIWVEKYQYREAAPHLILQAYLQRIINGGGRIDREYSAGRGRIDLCIEMGDHRYALELKIIYRPDTRAQGLDQLAGYLDGLGLSEGWLILFNRDPAIPWDEKITLETVAHRGKTIHIVGC